MLRVRGGGRYCLPGEPIDACGVRVGPDILPKSRLEPNRSVSAAGTRPLNVIPSLCRTASSSTHRLFHTGSGAHTQRVDNSVDNS
nr:hypothetical protein GCM10010200_043380 [Actinomadura rugatobispora]